MGISITVQTLRFRVFELYQSVMRSGKSFPRPCELSPKKGFALPVIPELCPCGLVVFGETYYYNSQYDQTTEFHYCCINWVKNNNENRLHGMLLK
ncbi:hypothetical protein SAMN05421579_11473 [Xenorhabdus japonica]|uniref:Uncharacterized protein n=1 Tax=Xenorhabdus japonica TaxID=53341 RepID=A0A1I5AYA0_9GAMM|nr:hypothetical protein SAMN05421579_11473 [Xenorhabdus japonica]